MSGIELPNPHLSQLNQDFAYHLGLPLNQETANTFRNVKFVCIGGTAGRMRAACKRIASEIYDKEITHNDQFDCVFESDRFSGYKIGDVLCVNHGMGLPSLSIMMHEVFKLLSCAECDDVTIIRIGTCGGIGVPPGTVIISEESLTAGLEAYYNTSNFGTPLRLPVVADRNIINELKDVASSDQSLNDNVQSAKTFCADDFYQAQGRLDGSFCDKTESDKQEFLRKLFNHGVRNIEMESAGVLALTHKVGIKGAVVCVTLLDRLETDMVSCNKDQMNEWIDRPIRLVTKFIRSKLQQ